jgi:hypothetical protein
MILEEIALYLESKGLVSYDPNGITGDTFLLIMPDQPDNAVALFQYGGPPPDYSLPYDESSIQILVRGKGDPRPIHQRAQSIYNALQSFDTGRFVEYGAWVVRCTSPNGVIGTGRDLNGRHEFRINFYVQHHNAQSQHREV